MKRRLTAIKHQSGVALLALLFALILAGSYAFYRSANLGLGATQQNTKLALRLAKAKEALIAYAVIDDKRPGRMLCPDIIGDGISPLLARDDCDGWVSGGTDIYSGWLPWKTLDLQEASDDQGTKFRYVISRFFGGDRKAPTANKDGVLINPTINSDTPLSSPLSPEDPPQPMSLALFADSNEVVAVIIATRGELDLQNANGDEHYVTGATQTSDDNDVLATITRQELMAAVEKRIAGEIRNCLDQHAASAPDNTYPWPAPLSNKIFKGQAKSLFGQVPDTQPGRNPDELLKQTSQDLKDAKTTFGTPLSASNVDAKYNALLQLQETSAYARALYDRLYLVATDLYKKALSLEKSFDTLDKTLSTITASSADFTKGAAGIPAAIDLAQPDLDAFRISLANSGFDIFLVELETENAKLLSKINLATADPSEKNLDTLKTQANAFRINVYANSQTPNAELTALIQSTVPPIGAIHLARNAVDAIEAAKALLSDIALVNTAINSASLLNAANQTIYETILAVRRGIDPTMIEVLSAKLIQALKSYSAKPESDNLDTLKRSLSSLQSNIELISRGADAVMSAKISALTSLKTTIDAVSSKTNPAEIQSATNTASEEVGKLILAIENNGDNSGDNIAQETLKIVTDLLSASKQTPPTTLAGGKDLRALAKLVSYWADNSAVYSKKIAQTARKKPDAESDSDGSAYIAAQRLLNSLDGDTGTIELLAQASKNPSDSSAQAKAQTALNKTQDLLDTLDTKNAGLESTLQSGLADAATPIKWLGTACKILQPPTGSKTWWAANEWNKYIFYQISSRFRSLPISEKCIGKLKANGAGEYCVVVISAGKRLVSLAQTRDLREVSQYFDDSINADVSRNGDAQNPSSAFSIKPISPTFNDRLAY